MLGKRNLADLGWILRQKETYVAVLRPFRILESPLSVIRDEALSRPLHWREVWVCTPVGRVRIRLN